jgi:hypothetical protein
MENEIKKMFKNNADLLIKNKDDLLKNLDELMRLFYSKENIFTDIENFLIFRSPEKAIIFDLLTIDTNSLNSLFKEAEISSENVKELWDIRKKYEPLIDIMCYYRYKMECGTEDRWNNYLARSYFDPIRKLPMIEINLSCYNKKIFHTIDDGSSIYRLGSTLQYIVRNELERLTNCKVQIDKKFYEELEGELNRNIEEQKKLRELLKK